MTNAIDIFPWNDNFNTGIAVIDEQHRQLVRLLNQLASHLAFQTDIPALSSIFDALADYAVYHFQSEESIWLNIFRPTTWKTSTNRHMTALLQRFNA